MQKCLKISEFELHEVRLEVGIIVGGLDKIENLFLEKNEIKCIGGIDCFE